jgi:CHAD domain-containing protein
VYIAGLADHGVWNETGPDLDEALASARRDRDRAYMDLAEILASDRYCRVLMDTMIWIEAGRWLTSGDEAMQRRHRKPVLALARKELSRRSERIVKEGRHLRDLAPVDRHEVRIELKKLRYGAEYFGSLFRNKRKGSRRKFLETVERLQETLGQLNDLAVAKRRHPADIGDRFGEPRRARTKELLAHAEEDLDKLARLKPFWH